MMDYKEINTALIEGWEVAASVTRDKAFYDYLLNNKVAFYYATEISESPTEYEKELIRRSEEYADKYAKTMAALDDICQKNGIEYLLYKTHKFIPEVVDGDIDIIVRGRDFQRFLKVFEEAGFECEEDEPGKGKCEKTGLCVIEPHTNISWRGGSYMDEGFIWMNPIYVTSGARRAKNVSLEVEAAAIAAKVIYEPSYLDIYSMLMMRYCLETGIDEDAIYAHSSRPDQLKPVFSFCKEFSLADPPDEKLPKFLPAPTYLTQWTNNFLATKNLRLYLLHAAYYSYWRIRYASINKLPFTHHHDWQS